MFSSTLLLLPTDFEKLLLPSHFSSQFRHIRICGFGLVQSGIETSRILRELDREIERIVLLGIAGTYDASVLPVGSAIRFSEVTYHGVGAGEIDDFQTAVELGWQDISNTHIDLGFSSSPNRRLLSVCSASGSPTEAVKRSRTYDAIAEDMEGYSVAAACSTVGLPCTIIRGISNLSGDRDKSNWNVESAMQSACRELLSQLSPPL